MYKREFETLVRHIILTKKENFSKTKAWIKKKTYKNHSQIGPHETSRGFNVLQILENSQP